MEQLDFSRVYQLFCLFWKRVFGWCLAHDNLLKEYYRMVPTTVSYVWCSLRYTHAKRGPHANSRLLKTGYWGMYIKRFALTSWIHSRFRILNILILKEVMALRNLSDSHEFRGIFGISRNSRNFAEFPGFRRSSRNFGISRHSRKFCTFCERYCISEVGVGLSYGEGYAVNEAGWSNH